jgi:hypothetical protein
VCSELVNEVRPAPVVQMPLYDTEVHSLEGLNAMRRALFDAAKVG